MITTSDQLQHVFVHGDKLVLRKGLLLLPFNQSFRNLCLEEGGLNGVYDLRKVIQNVLDLR